MLTVISPAKKLDFESKYKSSPYSIPDLLDHSQKLVNKLRKYSADSLAELMNLSPSLSELNRDRYKAWAPPFTLKNARPALHAFKGDVYVGMQPETLIARDLEFAQKHLRILSGLYGILRPLDLIQAYRLEMGTALPVGRKKNLYEFWGELIAEKLNAAAEESRDTTLVNLASTEYFKSVKQKALNLQVITPVFKEEKDGKLRTLGMFAKKARGMMTGLMLRDKLHDPELLKSFNEGGYTYREELSTETEWVFARPQPAPVGK